MSLPRTIAGACCLLASACSGSEGADQVPPELEVEAISAAEGYVSYYPGDLPIILCAPHGGRLRPDDVADRQEGNVVGDAKTEELARHLAAALTEDGASPHLVINHLHRSKLDANRPLESAAEGDPTAEQAWHAYHGFIEQASSEVASRYGRGLLVDVHGHAHDAQWVELGYLIRSKDLALDDEMLDDLAPESSLAGLVERSGARLSTLLRGPESLGALLEGAGYRAVPSPERPAPVGQPYFNGGYTVERHGSAGGGPIDAVQLEANREGVRQTRLQRVAFAGVAAGALRRWMARYY